MSNHSNFPSTRRPAPPGPTKAGQDHQLAATIGVGAAVVGVGVTVAAQGKTLKGIENNQRITNDQLSALNATNVAIAETNERIADISRRALDVAGDQLNEMRRTNLHLERQLASQEIINLENKRQKQLKQCAFSLSRELIVFKGYRNVPRALFLMQRKEEVNVVNLNEEELEEIADKEYAHKTLSDLSQMLSSLELELSDEDKESVRKFLTSIRDMRELPGQISCSKSDIVEISDGIKTLQSEHDNAPRVLRKWLLKRYWKWFLFGTVFVIPLIPVGLVYVIHSSSKKKANRNNMRNVIKNISDKSKTLRDSHIEMNELRDKYEEAQKNILDMSELYPELKVLV